MDILATPTSSGHIHVSVTQEPQTLNNHFTVEELRKAWRHIGLALKEAEGMLKKDEPAADGASAEAKAEKPAETKTETKTEKAEA